MTEWEEAVENAAVRIVVACERPYKGEQESDEDRAWIISRYGELEGKSQYSYAQCLNLARIEFVKKVLAELRLSANGS